MIRRAHHSWIFSLLGSMWLIAIASLALLPERVPMHWNVQGEVTRYGSRWEAALLLPIIASVVAALLLTLPRLGPLKANLERSAATYGKAAIATLAFLFGLHVLVLLAGFGLDLPIVRIILVAGGVLIAVLGNWMGKLRRNFWIGIRTPWTMANDVVWERTHRIGGRLLLAHGLISAVIALLAPPLIAAIWLVGGLIAIAAWSIPYSFVVYRRVGEVDQI